MKRLLPAVLLPLLLPFHLHATQPDATPFRKAVDAVQKTAHQFPEGTPPYFAELERGFRRLQKEFPNEGEVYNELLFVADHSPKEAGLELAREILRWPAPEATQAKTRGVIEKLQRLGQPANLTFTTTRGKPLTVADWKGKVVLVDFWATWCPPCREQLPELKRLYQAHHPRGLEIVSVSFDDSLPTLKRFVAREKIPWPQVADGQGWNGPAASRHGITSLPTLWLIDRHGHLRDVHAEKDLATQLEVLLNEPAAAPVSSSR